MLKKSPKKNKSPEKNIREYFLLRSPLMNTKKDKRKKRGKNTSERGIKRMIAGIVMERNTERTAVRMEYNSFPRKKMTGKDSDESNGINPAEITAPSF